MGFSEVVMEDQGILIWGLLFGSIGLGYAIYGKKQHHPVALFAGIGLMIGPYLVAGVNMLLVISLALLALPFIFRL